MGDPIDVRHRHNVTELGRPDGRAIVFAHGFGCDQHMWRHLTPWFEDRYRIALFDHIGAGESDPSTYDPQRYSSLHGYADDVRQICQALELTDPVFVGHSVSAMIGVLAAAVDPELFAALVLIGPSPRYVDDGDYIGGFGAQDIEELLDSLDSNYLGWSRSMAPVIMGRPDRPELGAELTASFCRADPAIARQFARVTFLSDNRADLAQVDAPTLVIQCREDAIAPVAVGRYVAERMPNARLELLDATGHCPNLSAPELTAAAIERFLATLPVVARDG